MIRRWDGKGCAFAEPVKMDYRFSPEEPNENGLTMADTFGLIDALVQKPLQYLHVSQWEFEKKNWILTKPIVTVFLNYCGI